MIRVSHKDVHQVQATEGVLEAGGRELAQVEVPYGVVALLTSFEAWRQLG